MSLILRKPPIDIIFDPRKHFTTLPFNLFLPQHLPNLQFVRLARIQQPLVETAL